MNQDPVLEVSVDITIMVMLGQTFFSEVQQPIGIVNDFDKQEEKYLQARIISSFHFETLKGLNALGCINLKNQ